MGLTRTVGKYQLIHTIGEGSFAKVKLAKNMATSQIVAIKIIDKQMVQANNLMSQVQREIGTMKLLNHPNIVRIHEVIGTKTKIYIVMEYVAGGQLSDKLTFSMKISEEDARKYFQQLIDAVDYCHSRGVYHRDLKPENLLLDTKGNLKVSDFGLSTLQKPGSVFTVLLTTCGSPSYVAPELLKKRGYDGASADIWACGVILFELLAGYLPFYDHNLLALYSKIWRAEYECPKWFTPSQKKLIGRILHPIARKRMKVADIIENEWFKKNYEPAAGIYFQENNNVHAALTSKKECSEDKPTPETRGFINAFQLIAMSYDLDLSSLFEEDYNKNRIMIGSKKTINETMQNIETAAKDTSLSVERISNSKVQMKLKSKLRSSFNLIAEVIEVSPTDCVVKVSKSVGESGTMYQEFCTSLSSLLTEEESAEAAVE